MRFYSNRGERPFSRRWLASAEIWISRKNNIIRFPMPDSKIEEKNLWKNANSFKRKPPFLFWKKTGCSEKHQSPFCLLRLLCRKETFEILCQISFFDLRTHVFFDINYDFLRKSNWSAGYISFSAFFTFATNISKSSIDASLYLWKSFGQKCAKIKRLDLFQKNKRISKNNVKKIGR